MRSPATGGSTRAPARLTWRAIGAVSTRSIPVVAPRCAPLRAAGDRPGLAHARMAAAIEAGEDLPFDPAGDTLSFVGPPRRASS